MAILRSRTVGPEVFCNRSVDSVFFILILYKINKQGNCDKEEAVGCMKAVNYLSCFYQSAGYELKEAQQDEYYSYCSGYPCDKV